MERTCPTCGAAVPRGQRETFCAVCTLQGALGMSSGAVTGPPVDLVPRVADFDLLEEISRGGVGVVYRAWQRSLGREVAIKLLLAGQFADSTARQRFRTEAEAAARLQHPHIVEIYEVGEHEGQPYLAMEYMPGGGLDGLLRGGPIPARDAASLVARVARAVQAAHDQGILHRDLKPSNILLDAVGEPRVSDFGLAKELGSAAELTLSGQLLGSPGFMAPEQAGGGSTRVTRASDIYSLGAVLYQLTTARAPFQGDSAAAILRQVERDDPVSPRRLNPAIPPDLERITLKCLEKAPARRFASAKALAEDLERFLSGRPVQARPLGWAERLWRWSRRRPGLAMGWLLLAALSLGSSLTAVRIRRAEQTAQRHLAIAAQNAYAGKLALADRAMEEGDLARTRELLESCIPAPGEPDLRTFEWQLLWRYSADESARVYHGHSHVVSAVVFLAGTNGFASGSWDGTVKFWSLEQTEPRRTLTDYQGRIWSLDLSSDGQWLAASGENGLVVWSVAEGSLRRRIPGAFGYGNCRFLPEGRRIAVASRDGAWVWDLDTGQRVAELAAAESPVAVSPDGRRLAARRGRQLILFDTSTWQELRRFEPGTMSSFGLRDLAFSPDQRAVLIGDSRGWLGRVELAGDRTNLVELPASRVHPQPHLGWVAEIAFAPDGRRFVSVGADQTVMLWRSDTRRVIERWRGHRHEVWAAAFSADGRWLVTGGKDETLRLWDLEKREASLARTIAIEGLLGPWSEHEVLVEVDVRSPTRRLQVFDWEQRRSVRELALSRYSETTDRDFESGTRTLALRRSTGEVEVWGLGSDPPVLRCRISPTEHPVSRSVPVRLSSDARHLAIYRVEDHGVSVWDASDGRRRFSLANSGGMMAMSADYLISAPVWETPRVWDARDGRKLADLVGSKERVSAVVLLRDGRTAVTAAWDGALRFYELPSGRLLSTTRSQRQGIYALGLSPDGRTLAAGGQDGVTHFWNVATRQQTARWIERRIVDRLWFTADGSALLQSLGNQLVAVRVPPLESSPR